MSRKPKANPDQLGLFERPAPRPAPPPAVSVSPTPELVRYTLAPYGPAVELPRPAPTREPAELPPAELPPSSDPRAEVRALPLAQRFPHASPARRAALELDAQEHATEDQELRAAVDHRRANPTTPEQMDQLRAAAKDPPKAPKRAKRPKAPQVPEASPALRKRPPRAPKVTDRKRRPKPTDDEGPWEFGAAPSRP